MSVDLDKINDLIETEVGKATATERKRIASLVNTFSKDLIDAIKNGGEEDSPLSAKPTTPKKAAAKKPAAKPKKAAAPEPEPEPEPEEEASGEGYDISEVEDDEVEASEYNGWSLKDLRAECGERGLTIPKGYKKPEVVKLMILWDEDQES